MHRMMTTTVSQANAVEGRNHSNPRFLVPSLTHSLLLPFLAAYIFASFVLHSILFLILPASPWMPKVGEAPKSHKGPKPFDREGEKVKIKNGLVSSFHATITALAVILWHANYSFEVWNWQRNLQGGIATPDNINGDAWFARVTSFTVGYFIYDTLCVLYYHRHIGNTGTYIHHIVIGGAILPGIFCGIGGAYHFIYLLEEISTPFLNFKNLYRDSPTAYKYWSIAFAVTFFLSRGVYGLIGGVTTYYCLFTYWYQLRKLYSVRHTIHAQETYSC